MTPAALLAPALARRTVAVANRFGFPVATLAKGHTGFGQRRGAGAAILVGAPTTAIVLPVLLLVLIVLLSLRATALLGTGAAAAFVLI
ncbi:hypothetical protein [Deinococcus radiodurans]|uniref:hypothetical protein n=1 Tax=Deinococcus radiodurans TaxID=1299 RepID=UPI001F42B80B|nr:hypothetical protein [Deinococcus radiodurans]